MSNPTVEVITSPEPVIDLARAKLHCKIAGNDRDAEVIDAVETARAWAQEWLGIPIGAQRLAYRYDPWYGWAEVPFPIKTLVGVADPSGQIGSLQRGQHVEADSDGPVTITIDTGSTTVPAPIKSAMLLVVADLIRNQQAQVEVQLYRNAAVENLLSLYRERLPI